MIHVLFLEVPARQRRILSFKPVEEVLLRDVRRIAEHLVCLLKLVRPVSCNEAYLPQLRLLKLLRFLLICNLLLWTQRHFLRILQNNVRKVSEVTLLRLVFVKLQVPRLEAILITFGLIGIECPIHLFIFRLHDFMLLLEHVFGSIEWT